MTHGNVNHFGGDVLSSGPRWDDRWAKWINAMEKWTETEGKLVRKFEFGNFSEAFAFMVRVAMEAERAQHHPHWINEYNKLEIRLSTHDAGGVVTEKDRKLAKRIDALADA